MLSFLVANPDQQDPVKININGEVVEFRREVDAINRAGRSSRQYFIAEGRKRESLYWYTEYECIMTHRTLYVNWCMLSTGDVVCGVWETRCNYPFQALLICTEDSGYTECTMMKCKYFRQIYPDAKMLPAAKFDMEVVMR
jgi:hypothetical protein